MPLFPRTLKGAHDVGAYPGTITVDIAPDPKHSAFALLGLSDYLDDTEAPMRAAKTIAIADMQNHFDTDTGPRGEEWLPLDPDYVKKKAKMKNLRTYPEDRLTLTRKMERASTSQAAWVIHNNALFFRTGGLPGYWEVHNFGSDPLGNAGFAADARERLRTGSMAELEGAAGGAHDSLGIGRGSATPQREFIGLGAKAVSEIAGIFDLWFDEGISNVFVHPKTGVAQARVTKGRFGPKIFPRF